MAFRWCPEDRHKQGLVLPFPIRANETLPMLRSLSGLLGRIDRKREAEIAGEYADAHARRLVRHRAGDRHAVGRQPAEGAAGQVADARRPKLLILDEPTRGIDVGAKSEIHRAISQLAAKGMSIIMISDDAVELIGMADRILVFRGGRVAAELARAAFDRERCCWPPPMPADEPTP